MVIISARKYDFKDEKTGKQIQGYSCYGISENVSPSPDVYGWYVEKFSISTDAFVSLGIEQLIASGQEVLPVYNRYGKVANLSLTK